MSGSLDNNLNRLDNNKYFIPEKVNPKKPDSAKLDNRIIFNVGSELKQVEIREDKPSFLTSRKWVEVKVADQKGKEKTIYLNINSLADNLNISKGVIEASKNKLGSFLNKYLQGSSPSPEPKASTPAEVKEALKAKANSDVAKADISQEDGDVDSALKFLESIGEEVVGVHSNIQEEGGGDDLSDDEVQFKATQAAANEAAAAADELGDLLNDVSSSMPYDDFDRLANRANPDGKSNVTAQDMRDALSYLEKPETKAKIQRMKDSPQGYGKESILLRKEDTGLKYNLEYFGPNKVHLRYHSDFAAGTSSSGSRVVDLYNKQLLVKGKMIVRLPNETAAAALGRAEKYREARAEFLKKAVQKEAYKTTNPTTMEDAQKKFNTGMGIEGVHQNESIISYSKEVYSKEGQLIGKVNKVAIFSIMQEGQLTAVNLKNEKEQIQAALGIVKNTASLNRSGLVHNDIKGENALFSRSDLGIETRMIDLELSTPLTSTANYRSGTVFPPEAFLLADIENLSPEQALKLNKAKDAWSLGEMLLKQIFNYPMPWLYINPYRPVPVIRSEIAKMQDPTVIANYVNSIPTIPPEYRHVIIGLLDPNPQSRMTAEQAEAYLNTRVA